MANIITEKSYIVNGDTSKVYIATRTSSVRKVLGEAKIKEILDEKAAKVKEFIASINEEYTERISKVRENIVVTELSSGEARKLMGAETIDLLSVAESEAHAVEAPVAEEESPAPEAPAADTFTGRF